MNNEFSIPNLPDLIECLAQRHKMSCPTDQLVSRLAKAEVRIASVVYSNVV